MHIVPSDQALQFMRAEKHGLITGSQHHLIVWAVQTPMADSRLDARFSYECQYAVTG